jgi:pilus assembly protein Flp/PilA
MGPKFINKIVRFLKQDDGPTAVEYAIMLTAVLLACVVSIGSMGSMLNTKYQDIENQMPK